MSHYALAVLVNVATPEEALELLPTVMAPYDEGGEWGRDGSRWDWFMLGGRYKGLWSAKSPRLDPANYSVCPWCEGTGTRPDMETPYLEPSPLHPVKEGAKGCNVCTGTGMKLSHPTEWEGDEGEVMPAPDVPRDKYTFALLTPDGVWHERGRCAMFGAVVKDELGAEPSSDEEWAARWRELMDAHPQSIALLVDCHV